MDFGTKSLAQLSGEAKEPQYVTLEVGSKISGYTKEYLERLCRLNKVEYRIWTNGQFVIELESLLRETHTILLSYDDIVFVDKKELTDSPDAQKSVPGINEIITDEDTKIVTPEVTPPFGEKRDISPRTLGTSPFSYVGRSVVSDSVQGDEVNENEAVPMSLGAVPPQVKEDGVTLVAPVAEETAKQFAPIPTSIPSIAVATNALSVEPLIVKSIAPVVTENFSVPPAPIASDTVIVPPEQPTIPVPVTKTSQQSSEVSVLTPPLSTIQTKAINKISNEIPVVAIVPPPSSAPMLHHHFVSEIPLYAIPHKPVKNLPVSFEREKSISKQTERDEWDAMLLGGSEQFGAKHVESQVSPQESSASVTPISSPYHPIKTAVDATEHHESLPLFPTVGSAVFPPRKTITTQEFVGDSHSGIPDLGRDKRVIVFEPQKFGKKEKNDTVTKTNDAIPSGISPVLLVPKAPYVIAPTVVALPVEEPERHVERKFPSIPAIRVMPQIPMEIPATLPVSEGEHHLILREKYPLLKSTGLNLAFAIFFLGTTVVLLGGVNRNISLIGNSVSYVAGVGAALQPKHEKVLPNATNTEEKSAPTILPFSDEIIVAKGGNNNSILIQPIFRNNAGDAHEYSVIPHNARIATSTGE